MLTSRGAFFLGLSLVVSTTLVLYGPQFGQNRFLTIATDQGVFVLDTKTQMINLCTGKTCRVIPNESSKMWTTESQPTYGHMQMAPTSSLGTVQSNQSPVPTCISGCNPYGQYVMAPPMMEQQSTFVASTPTKQNPSIDPDVQRLKDMEQQLRYKNSNKNQ